MRNSRMSGETAVPGDNLVYRYRPSLLGAPFELKLTGNDLEWVAGRRSGRVALRNRARGLLWRGEVLAPRAIRFPCGPPDFGM